MLWEHYGDTHHAWEHNDFTAEGEGAAEAQRAEPGPDHVRHAEQRPGGAAIFLTKPLGLSKSTRAFENAYYAP